MTLYKIALVREETLAEAAKKIWLNKQLFISKWEENNNWREKETILWDAFEALLWYLYIDFWADEVFEFVEKYLYPFMESISTHPVKSYKTLVQELVQRDTKQIPEYRETEEEVDRRLEEINSGIADLCAGGKQLIVGEETNEFSKSPCECCGEKLAGSRHQVTVFKK